MKNILILSIVAALLGGCIITPGYSDQRDGYYQRGNNRGDGYYRDNGYRDNGYRDYGYQGSPYRDHGG